MVAVWFNWRNKQEKCLSTKYNNQKMTTKIKYTYKPVAISNRINCRIILWVHNSEKQLRKAANLLQAANNHCENNYQDRLRTRKTNCHYVIPRSHGKRWHAQSEESSSHYSRKTINIPEIFSSIRGFMGKTVNKFTYGTHMWALYFASKLLNILWNPWQKKLLYLITELGWLSSEDEHHVHIFTPSYTVQIYDLIFSCVLHHLRVYYKLTM